MLKRITYLFALAGVFGLACGSSDDPSPKGTTPTTPVSTSSSSSGSAATPDGGTDLTKYTPPFTLTPLTTPFSSTANISLYFSVTDANGIGVEGLTTTDFIGSEDGAGLDPAESDFQTKVEDSSVKIPTVLMLDLSGSVTAAGALDSLKQTANTIIDNLLPNQQLAILSFAGSITTRSAFSTDKTALHAAVNAISQADGASTNLYGAIAQGMAMWNDGFATNGANTGTLNAGLGIVITDGKDEASSATLAQATDARGNKRLVAIGVGSDIDVDAMKNLVGDNASLFLNPASYSDLTAQLGSLSSRLATLGKSVYSANYCSPKRSGSHTLSFSLVQNGAAATACPPPVLTGSYTSCNNPNYTEVCAAEGNQDVCCPASAPYACSGLTSSCYETAEQAKKACSSSCVHCGQAGKTSGGQSIDVTFNANNYTDKQCPAFRGPNCKALSACCEILPPSDAAECLSSQGLVTGDETQCLSITSNECPTAGPQCQALETCCDTFSDSTASSCWGRARNFIAQGSATAESSCTSETTTLCNSPIPSCVALRSCCAGLVEAAARSQCDQQYNNAVHQSSDAACTSAKSNFCH